MKTEVDMLPINKVLLRTFCFLFFLAVVLFLVILPVITILTYNSRFHVRFETDPLCAFHTEQFENLTVETFTFE